MGMFIDNKWGHGMDIRLSSENFTFIMSLSDASDYIAELVRQDIAADDQD